MSLVGFSCLHGLNLKLSSDSCQSCIIAVNDEYHGRDEALVFSKRPIKPGETFTLRVDDVSHSSTGESINDVVGRSF